MNIKKIILGVLVLLWMGLIYSFSNMDNNQSNQKSINTITKISEKTIDVTNRTKITKLDSKTKSKELSRNLNLPLRKVAHGSVYFILCILLILLLRKCNVNKYYLCSLIICFIYACSDEIHQGFIYGRTPSKVDVLIDTLGSIIAIIIFFVINRYLKKGDLLEKN